MATEREQVKQSTGTKQPARARARGGEDPAEAREETGAEDETDEAEEMETLVSLLSGMAQMDAEAAFAYETAAELVDAPEVCDQLRAFAADHRRHVDDIGAVIRGLGREPAAAAPPPETTVFGLLTSALGLVGPRAVLLGLVGNEEFTNATYDTALELVGDSELRDLIQRNYEDEQRHITWLATRARPSEDEEPLATGDN